MSSGRHQGPLPCPAKTGLEQQQQLLLQLFRTAVSSKLPAGAAQAQEQQRPPFRLPPLVPGLAPAARGSTTFSREGSAKEAPLTLSGGAPLQASQQHLPQRSGAPGNPPTSHASGSGCSSAAEGSETTAPSPSVATGLSSGSGVERMKSLLRQEAVQGGRGWEDSSVDIRCKGGVLGDEEQLRGDWEIEAEALARAEAELAELSSALERERAAAATARDTAEMLRALVAYQKEMESLLDEEAEGKEGPTLCISAELVALVKDLDTHGMYTPEVILSYPVAGYRGHMANGRVREAPPVEKVVEDWVGIVGELRQLLDGAKARGHRLVEDKGPLHLSEAPLLGPVVPEGLPWAAIKEHVQQQQQHLGPARRIWFPCEAATPSSCSASNCTRQQPSVTAVGTAEAGTAAACTAGTAAADTAAADTAGACTVAGGIVAACAAGTSGDALGGHVGTSQPAAHRVQAAAAEVSVKGGLVGDGPLGEVSSGSVAAALPGIEAVRRGASCTLPYSPWTVSQEREEAAIAAATAALKASKAVASDRVANGNTGAGICCNCGSGGGGSDVGGGGSGGDGSEKEGEMAGLLRRFMVIALLRGARPWRLMDGGLVIDQAEGPYLLTGPDLKLIARLHKRIGMLLWQQILLFPDNLGRLATSRLDEIEAGLNPSRDAPHWESVMEALQFEPFQLREIVNLYHDYLARLEPSRRKQAAALRRVQEAQQCLAACSTVAAHKAAGHALELRAATTALQVATQAEHVAYVRLLVGIFYLCHFPLQRCKMLALSWPFFPQLDQIAVAAARRLGLDLAQLGRSPPWQAGSTQSALS